MNAVAMKLKRGSNNRIRTKQSCKAEMCHEQKLSVKGVRKEYLQPG